MKDQYFGDVNDYRKYGLLRAILGDADVKLGVCWMLTAPDSRTDGRHLAYLENPRKFRVFDPKLFDWLQETMHAYPDRRTIRIQASDLLAGALYFTELLVDGSSHRMAWFANCRQQLQACDLVFYDPDNGLERSVALGRRHSHKFLYWSEVVHTFSAGASVLVYQHFPREDRATYIERLAERLQSETGAAAIFAFRTPFVLFLLASHERHVAGFREVVRNLPFRWPVEEIAATQVRKAYVSKTDPPTPEPDR